VQRRLTVLNRESSFSDRHALRAICEITAVLAFPLLAIWVAPALIHQKTTLVRTNAAMAILGLLAAIGINGSHHEKPRQIGLRLDNFYEAGVSIQRYAFRWP
jgi:hypothetical protein